MSQVLLIFTGLGLFVFGLIRLSQEMQMIINVRIRKYIKQVIKRPFQGVILGSIVTALFQSSGATTVLTVGMVSAGLFSFFNSLGVILGADIGTTITAQLVAFRITTISPVFVILGIIIWLLARNIKWKRTGEVVFYFGLLFFGLLIMSQNLTPLKNNQLFINFIQQAKNPLLGIFGGLIFTGITQSSSVTTSILVLLGQKGLITIRSAFPVVLGANIGSTFITLLASLKANISGKKVALAHFLFKFLAVIMFFPFISMFANFLENLWSSNVAQQVAGGHFLFNLILAGVFLGLLKPFANLINRLVPGGEETLPLWPEYLDRSYLTRPDLAVPAVRKELARGLKLTKQMFLDSSSIIFEFRNSLAQKVFYMESVIDNLQAEIMQFLNSISAKSLTPKDSITIIYYAAITDKVERIGDHSTNLANLALHKDQSKIEFGLETKSAISHLKDLVLENLNDTILLLEEKNLNLIQRIISREDKINKEIEQVKQKQLKKFYLQAELVVAGFIFNDILINLERISDHCEYIARHLKEII